MGASLHDWNCLKAGAPALSAIKDGTQMKILSYFMKHTGKRIDKPISNTNSILLRKD